ncbi:hypothetical protein [Actinocatenispora comari]|nr:hypothetical protein [Actinocatenispora comari]
MTILFRVGPARTCAGGESALPMAIDMSMFDHARPVAQWQECH